MTTHVKEQYNLPTVKTIDRHARPSLECWISVQALGKTYFLDNCNKILPEEEACAEAFYARCGEQICNFA